MDLLFSCLFLVLCVFVPVWGYVHVSAAGGGGQRSTMHPLELVYQALVGCSLWVLETEPLSSGRAVSAHNHQAISAA